VTGERENLLLQLAGAYDPQIILWQTSFGCRSRKLILITFLNILRLFLNILISQEIVDSVPRQKGAGNSCCPLHWLAVRDYVLRYIANYPIGLFCGIGT